jgi:hypothetical protein
VRGEREREKKRVIESKKKKKKKAKVYPQTFAQRGYLACLPKVATLFQKHRNSI